MDQERREAISALGEENLQALRDMAGRAAATVESGGEAVFHTSRALPQAVHEGTFEDCPECSPCDHNPLAEDGCEKCTAPAADPEQLCFAVSTKTGTLMTREGRPLWATRKLWTSLPAAVSQVIPIKGAPPIGSMAIDSTHQGPDVVGRLLELLDKLESQAVESAKAVMAISSIAAKGAEGLADLSLIISQRVHFVELLDRAAAMIDPDRPEGTATYEARLDWLAKWRETVGR
jgi:hypothetical protein